MPLKDVLFSFEGRIGRATYWLTSLGISAVMIATILLGGVIAGEEGFIATYIIGAILTLWPSLALHVKRCHDRNRSGLFVFASIIPLLNIWYLIEIGFLRGTPGPNQYGPDPV